MKFISSFLLFVIVLVSACQGSKTPADIKKLEWLVGTWKGEASGQPFYETWEKISDNELLNTNFNITTNDTIISGHAKIGLIGDKFAYISEDRTLDLISVMENKSVFENKEKGEKFTFSLNEKNEWVALLQYPTTQVEYILTKIRPEYTLYRFKTEI